MHGCSLPTHHQGLDPRRWGTRRAGPRSPAPPGTALFAGEDGTDLGPQPPRPLCWRPCEYYFSKTPVRMVTWLSSLHVLRAQASSHARLFVTHRLQPARLLCPGDFPGKILEWLALSSSRGSSRPGMEPTFPLSSEAEALPCISSPVTLHHGHNPGRGWLSPVAGSE